MSLLDVTKLSFTVLEQKNTDDGYGGYIAVWADKFSFDGNLYVTQKKAVSEADRAEIYDFYTLLTPRSIEIKFHDVIRVDTGKYKGKIFRITTQADEDFTPSTATLDLKAYSMEHWKLAEG